MKYRIARNITSFLTVTSLVTFGLMVGTVSAGGKRPLPRCFIQKPSGQIVNLDRWCPTGAVPPSSNTRLETLAVNFTDLNDSRLDKEAKRYVVGIRSPEPSEFRTQLVYRDGSRVTRTDLVGGNGEGTGFLIDRWGSLLTSSRVVGDARNIRVTIAPDLILSARVIRVEPTLGLALARLNPNDLAGVSPEKLPRVLPLCYSRNLRVGETVFTVDYAESGNRSINRGFITASTASVDTSIRQRLGSLQANVPFIRADVASGWNGLGSPLIDRYGSAVGIVIGTIDSGYFTSRPPNDPIVLPIRQAVNRFGLSIPDSCGGSSSGSSE